MDYRDRLVRCKLLPLSLRREYLDCVFFFKALHGLTDRYVISKVRFSKNRGQLVVNENVDVGVLLVGMFHTDSFKFTFRNRIPGSWNKLPESIRGTVLGVNSRISGFKRKLFAYFWNFFEGNFDVDITCTWITKCRCNNCMR